ncbi:MAG: cytochrome C [Burkholderiales bacterium RIFCSPLOWO2_02_FULL_57_36]|nr:MAG: cytochrome C [Burkholderiales bacterium RIFCSPLOWO2_02_FULL_57_36]
MKTLKLLPFVIAAALAGCGEKSAPPVEAPAVSAPAPAAQPAPAPAPAAEAPAAPAPSTASVGDLVKGEEVYKASCVACHGAAVMGAPKLGDKAAWGPRIATGTATLHTNALNGIRLMPPKGGNPGLKDEDVKAAVDFMVSKAN